jgi:hypothetical protein
MKKLVQSDASPTTDLSSYLHSLFKCHRLIMCSLSDRSVHNEDNIVGFLQKEMLKMKFQKLCHLQLLYQLAQFLRIVLHLVCFYRKCRL